MGSACGIAILAGILALVSPLYGQEGTGPAGVNQADVADLKRANEFFRTSRLDDAESICERLVNKGGTVGTHAQALLERVKARRVCQQDAIRVVGLSSKGECQQAMEILQGIRQQCPDYPGLDSLAADQARCASFSPTPASPPAPHEERVPKPSAEPEAAPRTRQTAHDQGRASTQDTLLEDAIREFYAGNLPRADKLLEQYVGQRANLRALAYFYRGAIACADYFLTGANNQQKEALAREFFSKARQADRRFTPPSDYISPKIIEIYEKEAGGS